MKIYFDKENIVSLVQARRDPKFNECAEFIKKNFDIHYNFSLEEAKKDDFVSFWLSDYASGVGGKQVYVPDVEIYPERPLKSNFYNKTSKEDLLSVFLLSEGNICDYISEKRCILIGKVGEELSKISSLILNDTEELSVNIESWGNYCKGLPITDIIISDNHYFKHKEVYDKNDNDIIRALASIPNESPVNLVIITKEDEIDSEIDLEVECNNIKTLVKRLSGSKKSCVTILTTRQTHDRSVITNYYRIKHGSCLHLKDNGLKNDVTTEIKSHGNKKNMEITRGLIAAYQNIANTHVKCFGDKKSNFLMFEQ